MYKMTYTEKVELALNENWTIEMCNRYGVDVKDVVRKGKEQTEYQWLTFTKDKELNKVANCLLDPEYTEHNGGSLYYETGQHKWGYKSVVTKLLKRGWATIDEKDEWNGVYFLRATDKLKVIATK